VKPDPIGDSALSCLPIGYAEAVAQAAAAGNIVPDSYGYVCLAGNIIAFGDENSLLIERSSNASRTELA